MVNAAYLVQVVVAGGVVLENCRFVLDSDLGFGLDSGPGFGLDIDPGFGLDIDPGFGLDTGLGFGLDSGQGLDKSQEFDQDSLHQYQVTECTVLCAHLQ